MPVVGLRVTSYELRVTDSVFILPVRIARIGLFCYLFIECFIAVSF
jgi:hypothetical protein